MHADRNRGSRQLWTTSRASPLCITIYGGCPVFWTRVPYRKRCLCTRVCCPLSRCYARVSSMPVPHADFDCANDLMPAVHSIKLRTLNCIAQQLAEASCESREEAEEFDAYRLPYPLHVPCTCRSRSGRVPVFRRWSDGPAVVDLVNSVLSLNAGLQEFLHLLSPEKQFLMDIAKSLSLPTSASDSLACRISSAVAKLSPCRFLRSVSMAFCPLLLSHLRMIRALGCLVLDAAHEGEPYNVRQRRAPAFVFIRLKGR